MKYGSSFLEVDNSAIQQAIADKASKDHIAYLKQAVAFTAVYGFQYEEVSFDQLGQILCHDYGFNPFKYKSVEEGAIYNVEKHPDAWGRVRGRDNISGKVSWVCLDVDETNVTAEEMHQILGKVDHHIARTADKNNPFKYRIILPLVTPVTVPVSHWKYFVKSIADYINVPIDNLGASQCFYGYNNREVYTTIGKSKIEPSTHLEMASMKVAEIEEKRAAAWPKHLADKALEHPYTTFGYAYDCEPGKGTNMMLGAISQAKELGASKEYIVGMINSINDFWDYPMPEHRLQATVMTAI